MRKRGIRCRPVSVRLSVCLSVCHIRVLTAKHIVKLFSRPDSPTIQVSLTPSGINNSDRNLLSGKVKYTVARKKIAIFDRSCRLCRTRYEMDPWLLWNVNKTLSVLVPMTLSVTLKGETRVIIFSGGSP